MKDALLIMEHTCKQDIKKLCIIYIVYGSVALLATFNNQIEYQQNAQIPFLLLPLISFLAITVVHRRRIKGMLADGAFYRILLLPVKRSALLVSEFLFTFASYTLLLLIPVIIWYIWYLCFQQQLVPYHNQLMVYSLVMKQADLLLPYNLEGVSFLLLFLVSLTLTMNYLHLSFSIKQLRPVGILSLIIGSWILLIEQEAILGKTMALLLLALILWILLCKLMGVTIRKTF